MSIQFNFIPSSESIIKNINIFNREKAPIGIVNQNDISIVKKTYNSIKILSSTQLIKYYCFDPETNSIIYKEIIASEEIPIEYQFNISSNELLFLTIDKNGSIEHSSYQLNNTLFNNNPILCSIYWNGLYTTDSIYIGNNIYGIETPLQSKKIMFETGIIYKKNNGFECNFFNNNTFTITNGILYNTDKTIEYFSNNLCRIYYYLADKWIRSELSSEYFLLNEANKILYNNNGTIEPVTDNWFISIWLFATNGEENHIASFIGQRQDETLEEAIVNNTLSSLSFPSIPFSGMKFLYRVILQNNSPNFFIQKDDLRTNQETASIMQSNIIYSYFYLNSNQLLAIVLANNPNKNNKFLTENDLPTTNEILEYDDITKNISIKSELSTNLIIFDTKLGTNIQNNSIIPESPMIPEFPDPIDKSWMYKYYPLGYINDPSAEYVPEGVLFNVSNQTTIFNFKDDEGNTQYVNFIEKGELWCANKIRITDGDTLTSFSQQQQKNLSLDIMVNGEEELSLAHIPPEDILKYPKWAKNEILMSNHHGIRIGSKGNSLAGLHFLEVGYNNTTIGKSDITGNPVDYIKFYEDGTVRLEGDAKTWDDLVFDGSQMRGGASAPTLTKYLDNGTGSIGVWLNYYSLPLPVKYSMLNIQMPHRWKEGSTLYPHVHWLAPLANGGSGQKVKWQIEYIWLEIGEVSPVTTSFSVGEITVPNENIVRHKHYITELTPIIALGKTMSSIFSITLSRQLVGSNEFNSDIALLSFDLHYEIDSFGSHEEYIKWPS